MCEEEIDMNQFEEGRRFTDENYQNKMAFAISFSAAKHLTEKEV